jgi:hypothetical protein
MKKLFSTFIMIGIIGLSFSELPAQNSNIQLTPPPVPCFKFFPGVSQLSMTGIYLKTGEQKGQTGSPEAFGINANYSFSSPHTFLGAQNGGIVNFSVMNLTIPVSAQENEKRKMTTNIYTFGFHGVIGLINGEKRDIAGEIIDINPSMAIFLGLQGTFFDLNLGPIYQGLGHPEDIVTENMVSNFSIGLAGEFPLGFQISLIPFIRYTASTASITMKVPKLFDPSELYRATYTSDYDFMDFGTDIDIRPFVNAPDWIISVGTALAQIKGLEGGNILITLGIKYEVGKHYSSTLIGPVLH